MEPMRRMSISELAAEHLREGLRNGRWGETLPGVARLAQDLDVSRQTLRTALRQLETEGILIDRGLGRSRGIAASGAKNASRRPLRVAILYHERRLADSPDTALVLTEIMHSLEAAGHTVCICKKSQLGLKHDVRGLARQLAETRADAWLVMAGARPLLEWCTGQSTPCFALYGRAENLPLAHTGVDKVPAYRAATRQLLALGHRRIVLITREERRKPTPGLTERAFLEELTAHGVQTSSYHLPDWEETPEGFSRMLERVFHYSPPTALIINETPRFFAAREFLASRRIHVPEQVSLVSTDCDASLAWHHPAIAQIRWDNTHIVRRVVRWVAAVSKGKADRKSIKFPADFVPGGSIGPVWKG